MTDAFLHIPKTGGISVSLEMRKLKSQAPYYFYLRDQSEVEKGSISKMMSWYPGKHDLSEYKLMIGHGFWDVFINAGANTMFTVLREPRARLLSSYFFFHGSRPTLPKIDKWKFVPSALFDNIPFSVEGEYERLPLMDYIRLADKDANPIHHLLSSDTQSVLEVLKSFTAIGFTENMGEFVGLLSSHYRMEMRLDRRSNVTRLRSNSLLGGSVDEIVHALTEKTAPDSEVYRWAMENRKNGFSAPPDPDETLQRTLARFQMI